MKKDEMQENPLAVPSIDGGYTAILGSVGCIGDSLASGEHEWIDDDGKHHYFDIYEYSWGQFLARKCGLKVLNFSRGGLTAHSFHEYAGYNQSFYPEKACKAYIVALGVNDMKRIDNPDIYPDGFGDITDVDFHDYNNNRKSFVGDYVKILQRIRELQPGARIFLFTIPRGNRDNEGICDKHAEFVRTLPEYFKYTYILDFRKYAPKYDEEFKQKYFLSGHMNAMGYKWTADMVATYIDYIIRHNVDDFRLIGMVGTKYYAEAEKMINGKK